MKRYGYLVVEGPHDIEFAARLLREYGLRRITYKRYLEPFWEAVIPKIFPINDNLLKRVPVPVFLENETHSIAIHGAQGITRLVEMLDETCAVLNHNQIASYGFILDADVEHPPQQRFSSLLVELKTLTYRFLRILVKLQAHIRPLGSMFYLTTKLPERWRIYFFSVLRSTIHLFLMRLATTFRRSSQANSRQEIYKSITNLPVRKRRMSAL